MQLQPPIYYLEQSEFDGQYLKPLVTAISQKPLFSRKAIVLLQSNGCGHCTHFKPVYQSVANQLKMTADFATIQVDDTDIRLNETLPFRLQGVPTVIKYVNGHFTDVYEGDRSEEDFMNWVLN